VLTVVRLKTLSDVCYERCHVSCGASVTSSEASTDEFCVDDDVSTSLFPVVEDQEYLSLNVFEMGTLTGRERALWQRLSQSGNVWLLLISAQFDLLPA